jgi:N utilization substance protein A
VAVSCYDNKIDCVGACVGVRGSRIKNIIDELGGERIDIVRWNDSLQVMIPNALQPAQIEEVFLYPRLGRAIVLVREDQLSLAIGRRGQNVRLGSKLCAWDIEIMTRDELDDSIERAVGSFSAMEGIKPELAEALVGEGFLSYDDLSIIETEQLMEMGGLTEEQVEAVRAQAEVKAEEAERLAAEQRRKDKEEKERAEREKAALAEAGVAVEGDLPADGDAEGAHASNGAASTNLELNRVELGGGELEMETMSSGSPAGPVPAEDARSEDGPSGVNA